MGSPSFSLSWTLFVLYSAIFAAIIGVQPVGGQLRRVLLPPTPAGTHPNVTTAPRSGPKPQFRGSANNPRGEGLVKGEFVSKRVKVALSCQPEDTVVTTNFTSPFRGVIQAGDTRSPCKIRGDGKQQYVLRVPHNGTCGTRHVVSSGSFFNTLFIRYHPSLEMEGDQLKTIVCKFGTGSLFVG